MRGILASVPFAALTIFCWGVYGPLLHHGVDGTKAPVEASDGGDAGGTSSHTEGDGPKMATSRLRPFICVGLAYFVIAVLVPMGMLKTKGEAGEWTTGGTIWSLIAGSCGAMGALGIILAFYFKGVPIYVMPLVFGCAPVVNTLVSMYMTKTFGQAGIQFFTGIVLVALGGAGVMFFGMLAASGKAFSFETISEIKVGDFTNTLFVIMSVALTALCWGSYGSLLHKGQAKLGGSRLRALLCVGLAYFGIAVVIPTIWLATAGESGAWNLTSSLAVPWSMGAGAMGACGALGMILAFNAGGKPIFVMPLVFGGAPVINTIVNLAGKEKVGGIHAMFYVCLGLVVAGAVTVLVYAPKPGKPAKPKEDGVDEKTKPASDQGDESPASESKEDPPNHADADDTESNDSESNEDAKE